MIYKVSKMAPKSWAAGDGGLVTPSLGTAKELRIGKRGNYQDYLKVRKQALHNSQNLRATPYQKERYAKETASGGRSGGELGRGNNQVRARRRLKMMGAWGNGKTVPCTYCGALLTMDSMEIDKIVPTIGYDNFENLVPACRSCNASNWNKSFMEKMGMVSKESPTVEDVHVPTNMSRKRRDLKKKKMAMDAALRKGQPLRDPKGGLTAAGRKHFKRKEGANLKPGVKGPADTPEKMRRKGSFLTRFFTNPSGPMVDENGKPTRLALSAAAWGEPVPKNRSDAAKLAQKGRNLLDRYESVKKRGDYPGHPFRGNQWTKGGAGVRRSSRDVRGSVGGGGTGKVKPPVLKTRLTINGKRDEAKAQKVAEYMAGPASRFKNAKHRAYANARIKQMTTGVARPSGMSKKYGMTADTVRSMEIVLSKIFRAGREKYGI